MKPGLPEKNSCTSNINLQKFSFEFTPTESNTGGNSPSNSQSLMDTVKNVRNADILKKTKILFFKYSEIY